MRNDDERHGLPAAHAQRTRSLELAFVNRLDACTEDLALIRCRVERQHDHAQDKRRNLNARKRQAEERNVNLQEHRRATDNVHVERADAAQDADLGHAHEREGKTDGDGKRERHEHDGERHEEALEHDWEARYQNGRVEEQAQELVGVPRFHPILLFQIGCELLGG